jgi:hypothetical protein
MERISALLATVLMSNQHRQSEWVHHWFGELPAEFAAPAHLCAVASALYATSAQQVRGHAVRNSRAVFENRIVGAAAAKPAPGVIPIALDTKLTAAAAHAFAERCRSI